MSIKSVALSASALFLSTSVNAAIISTDWQTADDNNITQDTASGLEWLDLTVTTSRSYLDISSKFGVGQEFEGWRYASSVEVSGLFDAFGGDSNLYQDGYSVQNNGLFDVVSELWGDTYCDASGCNVGEGYSWFLHGLVDINGSVNSGLMYDILGVTNTVTADYIKIDYSLRRSDSTSPVAGSALVRESTVPVPAAAWLFGSGLLCLVGVARRTVRL